MGISLKDFDNGDFDRGAPRWKELLWVLVKNLFFMNHWPVPSGIKVRLLRWFGSSIGRGVVIRSCVNISFPWRVKIGDFVWLGDEVKLLSLAPIEIHDNCCISQRAFLCTGSHDFSVASFDLRVAPIKIEAGCWIASQAFIGPGVTVGSNSLVVAGAVVVRSVPKSHRAYGVPAKSKPIGGSDFGELRNPNQF